MQVKMERKVKSFDKNKIRKLLEEENLYITDLLSTFNVPDSIEDEEFDNLFLLNNKRSLNTSNNINKAGRAQDAEELQERLEIIKNKMNSKKSKMSERTKKKRDLKKLKKDNIFKSKSVSANKAIKNEKIKEEKVSEEKRKEIAKHIKPIFNEEGKMVFSKFDFAAHPGAKVKKTKKEKFMKNPKDLLTVMKDQKNKISELVQQGEQEKAQEVKQEMAWKKAFDKTEGKKVKDNVTLLQRAVKKKKDQKKKSKKKWIERKDKVEQDIAQRQKKRQENINKKQKEKKVKKLKRMSKKGRVIPGF